jgi:hypothetical protein
MSKLRITALAAAALLVTAAPALAHDHRPSVFFNLGFGPAAPPPPVYAYVPPPPVYYPPPAYYAPPVYYAPPPRYYYAPPPPAYYVPGY